MTDGDDKTVMLDILSKDQLIRLARHMQHEANAVVDLNNELVVTLKRLAANMEPAILQKPETAPGEIAHFLDNLVDEWCIRSNDIRTIGSAETNRIIGEPAGPGELN